MLINYKSNFTILEWLFVIAAKEEIPWKDFMKTYCGYCNYQLAAIYKEVTHPEEPALKK